MGCCTAGKETVKGNRRNKSCGNAKAVLTFADVKETVQIQNKKTDDWEVAQGILQLCLYYFYSFSNVFSCPSLALICQCVCTYMCKTCVLYARESEGGISHKTLAFH